MNYIRKSMIIINTYCFNNYPFICTKIQRFDKLFQFDLRFLLYVLPLRSKIVWFIKDS